jgi:DNA-binding response OmpR family regulator
LGTALAAEGFATEAVAEADAFLSEARSGRHAMGFLHHPWPSTSHALAILRDFHRESAMPCVVVGATPLPPAERVTALDAGADEVLDPAMPVPEAVARARAVLRRSGSAAIATLPAARKQWRLSPAIRHLQAPDGASHRLTAAEFGLLRLLVAASGQPVDRDVISREAFRRPWQPEDRAVDGLVKRLRRKLGPDAIQTSRGLGYALAIEVHSR